MKIISTKKPSQAKKWWVGAVCECKECGTKFKLEANDAKKVSDVDKTGLHGKKDQMIYLDCPTCRKTVWRAKGEK